MEKDRLLIIVKKHLDSKSNRSQSFDELLVEAVGDYLSELMEQGFIPHPQLDLVEEVLMEEAWDMIRKLTYGSLTLQDYRERDTRGTQNRRRTN